MKGSLIFSSYTTTYCSSHEREGSSTTPHALVDAYTTAVSDGDFERLRELVHPDATFDGTVVNEATGSDAFIQGFRNLRPITVRTDVRSVVVEGNRAAVQYDLVTSTPVGHVLCSEFLSLDTDGSARARSSSTGAGGPRSFKNSKAASPQQQTERLQWPTTARSLSAYAKRWPMCLM